MLAENEFPVGMLSPSLQAVIEEVSIITKAPRSMIAVTLLSVISLGCQGSVDVCRMTGLVGPTSLFFVIKASSGERKTTVEKLLMSGIYKFEKEQEEVYTQKLENYNHEMEIFKTQKKHLLSEFRTICKKNKSTIDIAKRIKELIPPQPPKSCKLAFSDITPAAMKEHLSNHRNSIGLMSNEAGTIFDGHALRDLPFINQLWDGVDQSTQRKHSNENNMRNSRLSLSLMVQPKIFDKYMARKGEEAKGIGFWARCLVCEPRSTQGYRLIEKQKISQKNLNDFHNKIVEIIKDSIELTERGDGICLNFTPDAEDIWIKFANDVEMQIRKNGLLENFRDYASKMADNMARIAALLHFFGGYTGDISADAAISAREICLWFGEEHIRLFSQNEMNNSIIDDETELWMWICNFCNHNLVKNGKPYMKKNSILQYGPNRFRDKVKCEEVLTKLVNKGRIEIGKERRTTVIKPVSVNEIIDDLLEGINF
ncbi:YfjI family protein [Enterobacter sp. UPMP2076]|uniref:YfjI family protein n=1 Tax=Enterobacter ludwigii TaxID=299767 RepID=UPI003BEA3142